MANNNNHHKTGSIVVRGRVLSGDALREYAERNGLCPRCGVYQTHKKKGNLLKPRFEPMTVTNAYNEITVYKGFCIAPTCYTLERAKQLLGEVPVMMKRAATTDSPGVGIARSSMAHFQPPPGVGILFSPQGGSSSNNNNNNNSRRLEYHSSHRNDQQQQQQQQGDGSGHLRPQFIHDGSSSHHQNQNQNQHHHPHHHLRTQLSSEGGGSNHRRTPTPVPGDHHSSPYAATPTSTSQRRGSTQEFYLGGQLSGAAASSGRNNASSAPTSLNYQESGGSSSSHHHHHQSDHHLALHPPDSKQRAVSNFLGPPPLVGDRTPSTITEHTEQSTESQRQRQQQYHDDDDPVIKAMEEKIRESNYLEFMNLLDHQQRDAFQIVEGFRLLRKYIVRDHMSRPDGVVLVGDNWVKVMNEKILTFQQRNEREVVVSGLITLTTISREGGNYPYKRSLIRKDAMEMTMKMLEHCWMDEEIMESAYSLIVSLSLHEKNSLNAKSFPRIAILVRKLSYGVLSDNHCGKGLALRALFHISNQRKKAETTGKTALHDVRNALGNEPSIRAILEAIIRPGQNTPPMVEAGLALLWKICLLKEENNTKVLGASVENISLVVQILEKVNTADVIEAACGLLTNLALDSVFPADLAHRAAVRVCDLMENPEHRTREVANVATHAFCNMLANPNTKPGVMIVSSSVVNTTLTLLKEYIEQEEVVEYSCLALSHAAFENKEMKGYLGGPECFNRVQSAFDNFVGSRGDQASLPVKDATLCFFASISGCDVGASALTESGLSERLRAMHARETDIDFKSILEVIMRNTSNVMENSGSGGCLLRQQPSLFLQLLRNAVSDEDIVSVIQELRFAGEAGLSALGNHGFDELVAVLTRYEFSPAVQMEGGYLLAEIYYRVPLDAVESPTQLPDGSWAVLHRKQVVDLLSSAIGGHPGDIETQIASMLALTNFLSPLCSATLSSPNVLQVQGWLSPVWKQTIEALTAAPGDENLQMSGLYLCWILTIISSEKERQNWVLSLLQQVFDTMGQFPSNRDLNLVACDILLQLKDNQDCTDFMGNSSCVEYMVCLLDGDDVELAVRASAILSTLTTNVFIAVDQMTRILRIIRRLIACMNTHQSQHYIVIHICVILEALLNFEGATLRSLLVEHGGVPALCSAIDAHESNATLCKHACRVISLIVPCLDANGLGTLKASFEGTFLPLLQAHIDSPESEAAILDLLWALGSTDDYFKAFLLSEQNLQFIVQAMSCHLSSDDLQRSGCGILWLLSGYRDGKRLIGNVGGIQAILNAMMAHNQSTSIQKEGLAALKNLATEADNKPVLAGYDCVRVVTYALWINYQHPVVISSALSALNNIAIDSRTKSVAPLPPEILDIVLSAMRRFPKDEVLQSNACFYLKSCTYLPDNRVLMNQHSAGLFSVLQQASTNFPQSCQERAQSIMKKVQG